MHNECNKRLIKPEDEIHKTLVIMNWHFGRGEIIGILEQMPPRKSLNVRDYRVGYCVVERPNCLPEFPVWTLCQGRIRFRNKIRKLGWSEQDAENIH